MSVLVGGNLRNNSSLARHVRPPRTMAHLAESITGSCIGIAGEDTDERIAWNRWVLVEECLFWWGKSEK